jgi:hypothetical protein
LYRQAQVRKRGTLTENRDSSENRAETAVGAEKSDSIDNRAESAVGAEKSDSIDNREATVVTAETAVRALTTEQRHQSEQRRQ